MARYRYKPRLVDAVQVQTIIDHTDEFQSYDQNDNLPAWVWSCLEAARIWYSRQHKMVMVDTGGNGEASQRANAPAWIVLDRDASGERLRVYSDQFFKATFEPVEE